MKLWVGVNTVSKKSRKWTSGPAENDPHKLKFPKFPKLSKKNNNFWDIIFENFLHSLPAPLWSWRHVPPWRHRCMTPWHNPFPLHSSAKTLRTGHVCVEWGSRSSYSEFLEQKLFFPPRSEWFSLQSSQIFKILQKKMSRRPAEREELEEKEKAAPSTAPCYVR